LNHSALNRRFEFEKDYVDERHICGSQRERWETHMVLDG
jgi:hypothetical protein